MIRGGGCEIVLEVVNLCGFFGDVEGRGIGDLGKVEERAREDWRESAKVEGNVGGKSKMAGVG